MPAHSVFLEDLKSDFDLDYWVLVIHRLCDVCLVLTKSNHRDGGFQIIAVRSPSPARYVLLGNTAGHNASGPNLLQCSQHGSRDVSTIPRHNVLSSAKVSDNLTYFPTTSLLDRGTVESNALTGVWCLPRTATWVAVNFGQRLAGTLATDLLIDGYNMIRETIRSKGDGPVLRGAFGMTRYGLTLVATNANNHQLTRGVLEAALTAVWQYMRQRQYQFGGQGTITFKIYDGIHQVGTGLIQPATPPT